jgi:uncharacterized protein YukE
MAVIQISAPEVYRITGRIQANTDHIYTIGQQYIASQEEVQGAGWIGDAQDASYITGGRIQHDLNQMTVAINNLVDTVHKDVQVKGQVDQDGRQQLAALGGALGGSATNA